MMRSGCIMLPSHKQSLNVSTCFPVLVWWLSEAWEKYEYFKESLNISISLPDIKGSFPFQIQRWHTFMICSSVEWLRCYKIKKLWNHEFSLKHKSWLWARHLSSTQPPCCCGKNRSVELHGLCQLWTYCQKPRDWNYAPACSSCIIYRTQNHNQMEETIGNEPLF